MYNVPYKDVMIINMALEDACHLLDSQIKQLKPGSTEEKYFKPFYYDRLSSYKEVHERLPEYYDKK